jgi:hypothetical protein
MTAIRTRLPNRRVVKRRRNHHCCIDCGVNTSTIGEYFILRDEVWNAAVPDGHGMLCIGCVETRLHRRLDRTDFVSAPANFFNVKSLRLTSRLWGEEKRNAHKFLDCLIDEVITVLRRDRRMAGLSILDLELLLEDVRVGAREKLPEIIHAL